jgi:site-specific recombinase XerD
MDIPCPLASLSTARRVTPNRMPPHSFRHYFVTTVLRGTGNLKIAQELARHKNIQVTQRYTHLSDDELDKAYYDVFERQNKK